MKTSLLEQGIHYRRTLLYLCCTALVMILIENFIRFPAATHRLCVDGPCRFASSSGLERYVNGNEVAPYQLVGANFFSDVINKYRPGPFPRKPLVLENGCDITGKTSTLIQQMTKCTMIALNCGFNSDFPKTLQVGNSRTFFLATTCGKLPFTSNVFDVVFSHNVLEHVRDLQLYISESHRVLRPGGIASFLFAPVWDSAKGHHIHTDMVHEHAKLLSCKNVTYFNDGTFIPDYSHLVMSKKEMQSLLQKLFPTCPKLADSMMGVIYGGEINRQTRVNIAGWVKNMPWTRIEFYDPSRGFGFFLQK